MTLIQRVTREGCTPETDRPDPSKVLAGDPVHTTWNLEDSDGLYCGLWQSTPGKWRIAYTEEEYCHMLEGCSVITNAQGQSFTVRAGDSFVVPRGFVGTWEVLETTTKRFVIHEPAAAAI